jgi:hydroxypyruvate isomerase
MRRREFVGACAGAAAGMATAAKKLAAPSIASAAPDTPSVPFSLSVMLWTVYRELPFEQRLEKAAEAGYHAVELVREYEHWTPDDHARVRRKRHDLSMVFDATAGSFHSLCDPAQRDAFLQDVRAIVPTMAQLECTRLILLSGNKVSGMASAEMHASCVEGLKRAADLTANVNIELLLENIDPEEDPHYFLTSVAEGFEVVREVGNPRVKFLYDLFHEQIAEGNLLAKLVKNLDLVGLIHVADVPGRHEPGTGEINYPNIFRKLGELGYNRYVAMEFLPTGETVSSLRAAREMAIYYGHGESKHSQVTHGSRGRHAAS